MNNDELYHHGIKGQKWGVRRFQDEAGRLTSAGKKRYDQAISTPVGKRVKKELTANIKSFKRGISSERGMSADYKKSNEVKFKDASPERKAARTAYAIATGGTGRWMARSAAKHKNGFRAASIMLGVAGGAGQFAVSVLAGDSTGTAAMKAAKVAGKATVSAYLTSGLAQLTYDALYKTK